MKLPNLNSEVKNKMEKKITFRDLSPMLKTQVICSWIVIILYAFMFLVGFIIGVMGAI